MNRIDALAVIEDLLKAGVDIVLYGDQDSGKTTVAKAALKNAVILNAHEIGSDHLIILKTLSKNNIIVENAEQNTIDFLAPILSTRTILGEPFHSRFIITARKKIVLNGCAEIKLETITANEWLEWAGSNDIHHALIELFAFDHDLLFRYSLNTIRALSNFLNSRPRAKNLKLSITAFLGENSEKLVNFLCEKMDERKHTNSTIFKGATDEVTKAYEDNLIASITAKPTKELQIAFMQYINSINPQNALILLQQLITSPKAQNLLNEALKLPAVKRSIDALLDE